MDDQIKLEYEKAGYQRAMKEISKDVQAVIEKAKSAYIAKIGVEPIGKKTNGHDFIIGLKEQIANDVGVYFYTRFLPSIPNCVRCGEKLQPEMSATRFDTNEWDQHTYSCKCMPGVLICVG